MDDCILFDRIHTASGHVFGRATLNGPRSLNALTLAMVDRLSPQFQAWANDPQVAGVVIDGTGDKSFCAGGDILALYHAIRATGPGQVPLEAEAFFEREYRLDHAISRCAKPVLVWGQGLVMGGGVGLMSAASHRVVTPSTRLSMPEITIGLYPDVGGTHFLHRMPSGTGLFEGLTGAPLNAHDVLFAGLADFIVQPDRQQLFADIAASRWQGRREDDDALLSGLLRRRDASAQAPASKLRLHLRRIEEAVSGSALAVVAERLRALHGAEDPWLAQAVETFSKGSPTSAAVTFALQQRAAGLSLADVRRLEYDVSLGFCVRHDFPEGVRALLVDKDKRPLWRPASLHELSADDADATGTARHAGAHPLADLQ